MVITGNRLKFTTKLWEGRAGSLEGDFLGTSWFAPDYQVINTPVKTIKKGYFYKCCENKQRMFFLSDDVIL